MEFTPGPEILYKYFTGLSPKQVAQFEALGDLYSHWNQRINVISRKDMGSFYQSHVLHSLGIAKVQHFQAGRQVLDVGTGGGFPGIPLAILFPGVRFHLVDSIGKKIRVVQQVIDTLGLGNASCEQVRAEQHCGHYDFVTCRAVTRLNQLMQWTGATLKPGGQLLCLKGGDLEEEIGEVEAAVAVYDLSAYFEEEFFETKKLINVWD